MVLSDWELLSLSTRDSSFGLTIPIPDWVSLEPLEFQILWQNTAGKRPIQPIEERTKFEKYWLENSIILKEESHSDDVQNSELPAIIDNVYSSMCMRSFEQNGPYGIRISHLRISINKYRKYAEFLVCFKTPSYEYSTWKRYSQLSNFYYDIIRSESIFLFFNTMISWEVLRSSRCFTRNLRIEYLKTKAFLLERVLHDALYEVSNPNVFVKFFT